MPAHVFIDETKAKGFVMVAAAIPAEALTPARRVMREFVGSGRRRLHFAKERDHARKLVAKAIVSLGHSIAIYDASAIRDPRKARSTCLGAIVETASSCDHSRLIFELDESLAHNGQARFVPRRAEL
jgi:hypothetical protein